MKIKRYYVLEHKGRTINITRDTLTLGPMPILWCNAGMYAIIPEAILEELFEGTTNGDVAGRIWWEQVYELPKEVGLLLCDKGYDGG